MQSVPRGFVPLHCSNSISSGITLHCINKEITTRAVCSSRQSNVKAFFKPIRGEPEAKSRKQVSIDSFTVQVEDISEDNEDEITITATVGCPLNVQRLKSEKRPVGRPRKPVDLDIEEFHDFNDLVRESVRYEKALYNFYFIPLHPATSRKRFTVLGRRQRFVLVI